MPKKRSPQLGTRKVEVDNLVVVSDTHSGCGLALLRPEGFVTDEGNAVLPSPLQRKLWDFWETFWGEFVPEATRGEPFAVVHNGDALDGVHHNSVYQLTHNLERQQEIAEQLLKPVVALADGRYYHVRGTEAHVGNSAVDEEDLAKILGAKPNAQGQFARYDIWKRVGGPDGPLVHALHHIGTTASAAHESSAVNAELAASYVQAGRWRNEPPDYIVRSHRHRSIAVELDSAKGYAAGIVTPAWQGKTPFAWKIPGARISEPQIGGILIRLGDEEHYHRRWVKTFGRSAEE
jgi:hypothetical protein